MIRIKVSLLMMALVGVLSAQQGWHFERVDPHSKRRVVTIDAKSMEKSKDADLLALHEMSARMYSENGLRFKEVKSAEAVLNTKTGTLIYGPGMSKVFKVRDLR